MKEKRSERSFKSHFSVAPAHYCSTFFVGLFRIHRNISHHSHSPSHHHFQLNRPNAFSLLIITITLKIMSWIFNQCNVMFSSFFCISSSAPQYISYNYTKCREGDRCFFFLASNMKGNEKDLWEFYNLWRTDCVMKIDRYIIFLNLWATCRAISTWWWIL